MPGVCIHEFFWPLRAADGRYYQVCRRCGAQREYDWTNMRRVDSGAETTVTARPSSPKVNPRLTLLVELEPAHRVFLRNLADTLRPATPGAPRFWTLPFWREVIYYSGMPWGRFAESLLGHVIALIVVVILSQPWSSQDQPLRRSMFENTHLTYYKPDGSFPALRGNSPRVRPVFRKPAESARRGSIRVAPEPGQAGIEAPDIKLKGPARPNLLASNLVPPVMPLASTGGPSRLSIPTGPTSVVAPAPEVNQATSRRLGLPRASGVAPVPEPGVVSSKRVMTVPGATVIAPPPVVQALIRRIGDVNIGPSAVVAPSPRLPIGEQHTISGALQATLGSLVAWAVPPPPAAPHSGTLAGGRAELMSGAGPSVVPPPPSVQGISNSSAGGRVSSLSSSSLSSGSLSSNSVSSTGVQVVPPPPSLEGAGTSGAGQRANSLSGAGSGGGLQGVPPAPSVGGLGAGGKSDRGGRQMAINSDPVLQPSPLPVTENPPQQAEAAREPGTEEMPLRLIGLAMALPNSSYFSNYEVYIAERRLRKNLTELVKLVYVYLPYQRRLSDYGVDNSKVYRLLVSRDQSCDESLMQMTWPEADPRPDLQNSADAPGLTANDKKGMLPCYRTTADDYRKAISRR
jgi:hypothetical protein